MGSKSLTRSRWAAIGAAVAVTLGGGGLIGVSAASGDASSLKTVDPVRILDTREGDDAAKVSNGTMVLKVTGEIPTYVKDSDGVVSIEDATVVPAGAGAVSMNLTVSEGSRNQGYGFVTAFPCADRDAKSPNASTLNFVEGVDVANSTVVPIDTSGNICLYVYGSAHVIVDVNGYYETAAAGAVDAYTKAEADARYASLGESDVVESVILDRYESTYYSAPAVDVNNAGLPVLAYAKKLSAKANPILTDNLTMELVFCNVRSCDVDTNTVIDTELDGAVLPDLKLTGGDVPYITYTTLEGNFLTRCLTSDCSGGVSTPIKLSDQTVAPHLELDSDDLAGAAWVDDTGDLHFMKCENPACSSRQSNTVTSGAEQTSSDSMALAISSSGNPIIAYSAGADFVEVRLIFCNDKFCAGGDENVVTIDANALPENGLDLALRSGELPVVAYIDTDQKVSIIVCQNADCSSNTGSEQIVTADRPAIEIDSSGLAHVAFFQKYIAVTEVDPGDPVNGDPVGSRSSTDYRLSALRCGDAECAWMALDQTPRNIISFRKSGTALAADGSLFATSLDYSLNTKLTIFP